MKVTAVRFEKLVIGDEPKRFVLTLSVDYQPDDEELPYVGRFAIPVSYDEKSSMSDIREQALKKLYELFEVLGSMGNDQFMAAVEAGKKPYEFPIDFSA